MLCLLLFSMLVLTSAHENFAQVIDDDLDAAIHNFVIKDGLENFLVSDIFDMVVTDAIGEFDRFASLGPEEIELAREQFFRDRYYAPDTDIFS